ncbi:MAG TPA: hypothetical protein VHR66_09395 [Gemmataceae bacterium]|jgi:hypothetical protein|nr:hypothetical protein [Gemmataceae bacterium]
MIAITRNVAATLALVVVTGAQGAPVDSTPPPIPANAIAVVQVNGLERVQTRFNELLRTAAPDRADEASRAIRGFIATALGGRDLSSLRPDGRLFVCIADLEKLPDDAGFTFLFPATDATDFRSKFLTDEERKSLKKDGDLELVQWEDRKEPYFLIALKEYVVVCSDRGIAEAYARGKLKTVDLSDDAARRFLDADLSLFVNVRELSARFGEQMKKLKSLADLFLKGDTIQGVSKSQLDQLKGVVEAAFQVLEDGTAAVLAIDFRPDGIAMRGVAQFGATTATNQMLKKYQLNPLAQLDTLPAGQSTYSTSALNVPGSKMATLLSGSFSVEDTDAAASEAIKRLQKELDGLDRGIVLTAGKLVGSGLEVSQTNDAAKIAAARLGLLKAVTHHGTFAKIPLKDKPDIRENTATIGRFALHQARLRFDFDAAVADLPENARAAARTALKQSVGGDELSVWIGSDGNTVLQLIGGDWAEAKVLAEAYVNRTAPLQSVPAYLNARKKLPADASMVITLDAAQVAEGLLASFNSVAGAPKSVAPKPAGAKTAFVVAALILRPEQARIEVFVPAEAVDVIRRLIEPLLDNDK